MEISKIVKFIDGKNLFITGGTGYVGKLVIEQLLRKCNPNRVYLLIRSKRNVDPKQRIEEIFQSIIYSRLRKEKPWFADKIVIINGNLMEDNLGLSEEVQNDLIENVNIVIHGAATLRFDESLKLATRVNVKGTLSVIKLCHRLSSLSACIYISTAYSFCPYREINEELYAAPISCDDLLKITESLNIEEQEPFTARLLGKWPNTYTFTKAVAEDVIRRYGHNLPVSIFRPAMIVGTMQEPIPGWIDNLYGPFGFSVAVAYGTLRVIPADPNSNAEIVPGDMVASSIIAATLETSRKLPSDEIKVYNYVLAQDNRISWGFFANNSAKILEDMPLENAFWPFSYVFCNNSVFIVILSLVLHLIPVLIIEAVFLMLNQKTNSLHLYKKAKSYMDRFQYFTRNTWRFTNNNVVKMWTSLNSCDQELFPFDMSSVNWNQYLDSMIRGGRLYMCNESPENIPGAIRKYKRQLMIQKLLLLLFGVLICWLTWQCCISSKWLFV